jgi:hypothetical protein
MIYITHKLSFQRRDTNEYNGLIIAFEVNNRYLLGHILLLYAVVFRTATPSPTKIHGVTIEDTTIDILRS